MLIAVSLFAAGEDVLLRELGKPRDFFAHHFMWLVNTKGYAPSNDHTRLLEILEAADTSLPGRRLGAFARQPLVVQFQPQVIVDDPARQRAGGNGQLHHVGPRLQPGGVEHQVML